MQFCVKQGGDGRFVVCQAGCVKQMCYVSSQVCKECMIVSRRLCKAVVLQARCVKQVCCVSSQVCKAGLLFLKPGV